MKNFLSALSAGLMLASCVPSTPQARIQQYPQKFSVLGEKQQALVQQGQISRGMSRDAVFLAWGASSGIFQGSNNGKPTERWDYARSRPVYVTNFYGGYGYGSYGYGGYGYGGGYGAYGPYGYSGFGLGPEIAFIPYRAASVWFINGRVDSWERAK